MITNERQYKITRAQHAKLVQAIAQFDLKSAAEQVGSRVLAKAELDALQSEASRLQEQLDEYRALKSGAIRVLRASSLSELPQVFRLIVAINYDVGVVFVKWFGTHANYDKIDAGKVEWTPKSSKMKPNTKPRSKK
jgi:hypothetical protein